MYLLSCVKSLACNILMWECCSDKLMHAIKEKHNIALFTVVPFEFLPIFENTLPSMPSQF